MNAVVICLDTFRADLPAAVGRNREGLRTPNLDRLVREGVYFENAFGESQPTIQFRRNLCTGMRGFPFDRDYDTLGAWPTVPGWHKIPPEQPTLAEILLEQGYATGLVADTYHMFKPTHNFTRGMAAWDFIRGQETDNYRTGPLDKIDLARYLAPGLPPRDMLVQHLLNNQDRREEADYSPHKVFSSAIRFLEDNHGNRPFFLWIDEFDPHEPWDPPAGYADHYAPGWNKDWEPVIHYPEHDDATKRRLKANYLGECEFVDKQVGRLIDKLEQLRLLDDTLIVVLSDHGMGLGEHGTLGKGQKNIYRHNIETLSLWRFPKGQHAGRRIGKGFVQAHDIFPTVLSALGVRHAPVDGLDLMPLIRGEVGSMRDHIVTGWAGLTSGVWAAVRTEQWHFALNYFVEDPRQQYLFDLVNDPDEMVNLIGQRPVAEKEMRERLEQFLGEKLPGAARDRLYPNPHPCKVWFEQAPWAKNVREYRKPS